MIWEGRWKQAVRRVGIFFVAQTGAQSGSIVADSPAINRYWEESSMSKPSRRPTREARKEHKQKCLEAQRQLRQEQAAAGLEPLRKASVVNRLYPYRTEAEEQADREVAVGAQLGVLRKLLPTLLKDLGKIPDVRPPKKVKHQLTVVRLYGLLSFVFQMS